MISVKINGVYYKQLGAAYPVTGNHFPLDTRKNIFACSAENIMYFGGDYSKNPVKRRLQKIWERIFPKCVEIEYEKMAPWPG